MKIARIFPRKTKASPDDKLAFFDSPGLFPPEVDEVHISTTFSYDMKKAEQLIKAWNKIAPVKFGGPAYGYPSEDFIPGFYLKNGYVITSRGCPNKCSFCLVWRREGNIRELPITDGWNILDDNLLACSESHIRSVFAMLKKQPQRAEFTGGLEANRLKDWHIDLLVDLKPQQFFMAYDTPDDLEPLIIAGKKIREAGFRHHEPRCYVLIGYKADTFEQAEKRLRQAFAAGFLPMAMLYRNAKGETLYEWRKFQRLCARPVITSKMCQSGTNQL